MNYIELVVSVVKPVIVYFVDSSTSIDQRRLTDHNTIIYTPIAYMYITDSDYMRSKC